MKKRELCELRDKWASSWRVFVGCVYRLQEGHFVRVSERSDALWRELPDGLQVAMAYEYCERAIRFAAMKAEKRGEQLDVGFYWKSLFRERQKLLLGGEHQVHPEKGLRGYVHSLLEEAIYALVSSYSHRPSKLLYSVKYSMQVCVDYQEAILGRHWLEGARSEQRWFAARAKDHIDYAIAVEGNWGYSLPLTVGVCDLVDSEVGHGL